MATRCRASLDQQQLRCTGASVWCSAPRPRLAQARLMRDAYVQWMYAETMAAVQPLFSHAQVTAWATYLDRCWMHPLVILEAWIDGDHTVDSGFVSTSGVCESSHHFWTQHINRQFTQKLPGKAG